MNTRKSAADQHAEHLIETVVLPLARLVQGEHDVDAAAALWATVPVDDRAAVVVLLAALVNRDKYWRQALSWWTGDHRPARVEHADWHTDSPAPLVVTRGAGDA